MVYGGTKRGMRKRPTRRRARASNTKKGLTQTEKKQVTTIAKRAVNVMIESKYFHTAQYYETGLYNAWLDGNQLSEVGVLGFTTGFEKSKNNDDVVDPFKYGVNASGSKQNMKSLEMNRVFLSDATNLQSRSYALEGSTCRPAFNETKWLLSRKAGNTTSIPDRGLTYKIRMLRLRPRTIKGSYQKVDPGTDAFLDAFNREFGVYSLDDNSVPIMDEFQFHLAKCNSRRYHVLEDSTMTMKPTMMFDETTNSSGAVVYQTRQSENTQRIITRKHNLGTELFYPSSLGNQIADSLPQDGFVPEFVLFHAICVGSPFSVGSRTKPEMLNISCRPVSTFKDA